MLGNVQCNPSCNTEDCGFDGGDCLPDDHNLSTKSRKRKSGECSSGCPRSWQGDGICDTVCDTAACGYDSGDCIVANTAACSTRARGRRTNRRQKGKGHFRQQFVKALQLRRQNANVSVAENGDGALTAAPTTAAAANAANRTRRKLLFWGDDDDDDSGGFFSSVSNFFFGDDDDDNGSWFGDDDDDNGSWFFDDDDDNDFFGSIGSALFGDDDDDNGSWFGFDDDDDNDFFSTVGGAFFDDDDGGDDCWLCWWSDDDNGADDDWFGFGGSWSNDDDDDDGWGGFLWDIGTTIVGAVCAVCGAIITGAEFIFNAVQCDSLACIGKEAFGSVVDHFTPDAISLAKSVWELGESSVSSTEYVSDTSITATCEELYGHRNSRCSDRTYFNVGSYNGHLEFVSQDDWLDSEAHDISVVVEDRDTHATRIVHETVGCVESLHSTSMVASEFAEDAYCGCVHHRHGSSFAEENHLETVDDLIAACLAESGAEFAVIKQADQEDEVTSFVEHLNHGELEARCAAGRHHNSGSLTCTSDGYSVTHVFTGITQDAPAYLTVEQAGDLDASSEYITLKIGGSTIASCKTSTTDWAIAPACKNVDVTRYVTSSGTLTVVADATYEVDADDVTATQGAELAVKFALHVQDSAPTVTTPSTSTAIDGGGGGDGTDGYDDFPFSGQAQYGFEYEELNHLYGNIFGNDYMEAYIDLLKQFSDYKGDDDDGYYSIEQAFAGCVAAKEDGCAEEYAHCALRAQRGDDTADADDYAYGSYTEHNRDICDCMSNTCQTAIDQCHAARHLAAVNWNSQYHDRDTAVYYGAMIDSHFKESRFCSAVGSARDDGVFDLHVVELRVMLKLMLHCENKALQMHADYMEKDTGFEGLRCDSEHVAEDKLIVVQLLKSIAGGMPHAEQARILTALKKHGGFATFGGAAVDGELDLDVDMKAVMADVFTSNGGADVLVAMREAGIGTDEIVRTTGISEASLLAAPPSTDTLAIESSASTVAASIVVATVAIPFAVVF